MPNNHSNEKPNGELGKENWDQGEILPGAINYEVIKTIRRYQNHQNQIRLPKWKVWLEKKTSLRAETMDTPTFGVGDT